MSDIAIKVDGLGKKYRIRHNQPEQYTALRDVIARQFARALNPSRWRGRATGTVEEFWALKDVSFEVKRGEVVGIVGRNGAGKSTLLKVLSRITEPSTGRIELNGHVSSLLEVGTGFHPELTGSENIFLNASILGMTRQQVRRKFDQIVEFAEVEKFLDTPVKRYSSGMYMRLAFAVAAHMEPDILIVDEVLAVGDSEFQKKCLGRMGEVSEEGRTVLFVSHNLGALLSVCETGFLFDNGELVARGEIEAVAETYRRRSMSALVALDRKAFAGPLRSVSIDSVCLNDAPLKGHQCVLPDQEIVVRVRGDTTETLEGFRVAMALFCGGTRVLSLHDGPEVLRRGGFETVFTIPPHLLRPGEYWVALGGRRVAGDEWFWAEDLGCIEVMAHWSFDYDSDNEGVVNVRCGARRVAGSFIVSTAKEVTGCL